MQCMIEDSSPKARRAGALITWGIARGCPAASTPTSRGQHATRPASTSGRQIPSGRSRVAMLTLNHQTKPFSFLIIVVLILRLHLCWATTALAFTAGSNRLSDLRMWCTGLLSAVMVGVRGQLLWSAWCTSICSSSLVEQLT